MFKPLLRLFFCLLLLSTGVFQLAWGQGPSVIDTPPTAPLTWFIKQNQQMVVRRGAAVMPMDRDVTLANGARISHTTGKVELLTGGSMPLQEGEAMSQNGELVGSQRALQLGLTPAAITVTPGAPAMLTVVSVPVTPAVAPAGAPVAAPASAVAAPPAFTYQPAAPVNGKLKGVVELGASGFNSFIIRVDKQQNWKLEKSDFGNSLVMENLATDDDVRKGLKSYIGQMLDYGVGGKDIHFVVSSGATMAAVTRRIIATLKELGYVVNTVTPEQEGALALKAALPPTFTDKAFVADIGSGNTKISWTQDALPKALDTYGAKYYQKGISDADVARDVTSNARQVPSALRQTCFIIGGVPYELAKINRQGQERYTVLSAPAAYAELPNAKTKAGLTIYKALAETTGCQQFVFDWDANFTIGYLLSLP
ncbi:hypothetical protein KLP40_01855 [Hymenobacter sp. NST-14]|uniref:DUF6799 domain-containing protein n=1 Tax=Hymenobacter piscis TaxID=2839984 RepID=UPI001C0374E6|nr:DUF6799 domain-containing protein [Hymenobacter piscis]MBT9391894.1 hypothetical protein [Hymenobacter piscis]